MSSFRRSRWWMIVLLVALVLPLAAGPAPARAADPTYYPQTGHYLGGAFRDFWNANGGLYVFGYPITEEYTAANGHTTQWFERARFEFFPEYAGTPFMVQLGLLGTEASVGRVFPQIPPRANDADHRYFPETKHMIMWGFKTIWETRGALPIYGYPISEEIMEVLPADGKWHTVQYFERARFEYWPEYPDGERVLVSDLGRRMAPRDRIDPLPPGSPPGGPPANPPGVPPAPPAPEPAPYVPPNIDATVEPPYGPVGTVFYFNAFGFQPGESVSLWATAPDQSVVPADFTVEADDDGSLASWEISFATTDATPSGLWALTAQGNSSGHASIGYFAVTGTPAPPPPPGPAPLPENQNASTQPREGPPGTVFYFFANGFVPFEVVDVGAFDEAGNLVSNVVAGPADENGSIDYLQIRFTTSRDIPPGIYVIYGVGESSGREAFAFVRVTADVLNLGSLHTSNPNARPTTQQQEMVIGR